MGIPTPVQAQQTFLDFLFNHGITFLSVVVNFILGGILFFIKRDIHKRDKKEIEQDDAIKTLKDLILKEKEVEELKDIPNIVRFEHGEKHKLFAEEIHESFKQMSEGQKEERKFWQSVFGGLKENIDELYNKTNTACREIEGLKNKIDSEIKRLDEKAEANRELIWNGRRKKSDRSNDD